MNTVSWLLAHIIPMTAGPLGIKCLLPRNSYDSYDRCNIKWSKMSKLKILKHFLWIYRYSSLFRNSILSSCLCTLGTFCIFILSTSFLQNYFVTFRMQHFDKSRTCTHIFVGSWALITFYKSIAVIGEVWGQIVTGS